MQAQCLVLTEVLGHKEVLCGEGSGDPVLT